MYIVFISSIFLLVSLANGIDTLRTNVLVGAVAVSFIAYVVSVVIFLLG